MPTRDLHNNIKVSPAINPGAAITGNSTTDSALIDTADFGSTEFAIQSGAITDGAMAFSILEGEEADGSDLAAASADDLLGDAPSFSATDDNTVKKVGYRGSKRYVKLRGTQSGATSGGIFGAVAIQGHPKVAPVA